MYVDWRTVRAVVQIAKPDWQPSSGNEETPDSLAYDFCKKVIDVYIEFSKVTCCECNKKYHPLSIYRCWDCGGYMCEGCVKTHFGPGHTPHPKTLKQYKEKIETLESELATIRLMSKNSDE